MKQGYYYVIDILLYRAVTDTASSMYNKTMINPEFKP